MLVGASISSSGKQTIPVTAVTAVRLAVGQISETPLPLRIVLPQQREPAPLSDGLPLPAVLNLTTVLLEVFLPLSESVSSHVDGLEVAQIAIHDERLPSCHIV